MYKFTHILMSIWMLIHLFDAPLRYLLDIAGIPLLIYVKDIILVYIVLISIIHIIKRAMINKLVFYIITTLFIGCLIGLLNQLSIVQVLFGLKIYLPFVCMIFYFTHYNVNLKFLRKLARIYIPIIFFALIVDYFFILPWQGFSYNIGEHTIEGSRFWTTMGIQRLSGIQKTSFGSAILLYSLLTLVFLLNFYIKEKITIKEKIIDLLLTLMVITGVLLTTSKTTYIALVGLFVIFTLFYIYNNSNNRITKILSNYLLKGYLLLLFLYATIPTLLITTNFSIHNLLNNNSYIWRFMFESYISRLVSTWPQAIELFKNTYFNLFGRGVGGIGTAQMYFENNLYNPADNFFIYIYVTFGIISFLFIIILFIKLISLKLERFGEFYIVVSIYSLLIFGATLNVIESTYIISLLGLILGLYIKQTLFSKEESYF
ncbi:O-antigen ligase family protein [Halobacillus rhizosphaerae]|uniref:O-antigen ligase family protein n=1 Tax=Halobacillus rhizosphaerae TaxID=3064889 RepID=UPI00398AA77C